jgi:hypothetical protein
MVKLVGSILDHASMMRPHVIAHPISTMKVRGEMSVMIRPFFHSIPILTK